MERALWRATHDGVTAFADGTVVGELPVVQVLLRERRCAGERSRRELHGIYADGLALVPCGSTSRADSRRILLPVVPAVRGDFARLVAARQRGAARPRPDSRQL